MKDIDWIEAFKTLFNDENLRKRLRAIRRAGGCREGWLQGEMFHFFNAKGIRIRTNEFCISDESDYLKADIDVADPDGLVAECKVLGKWGFHYKMLDGRGIRGPQARLQSTGELRYGYQDLDLLDEPAYGLLSDFFRLALSNRIERDVTRLLILVVYTDPPKNLTGEELATNLGDPLGQLLLQVAFGDPEDEHLLIDGDGLMVKIWRVKPHEGRLGQ